MTTRHERYLLGQKAREENWNTSPKYWGVFVSDGPHDWWARIDETPAFTADEAVTAEEALRRALGNASVRQRLLSVVMRGRREQGLVVLGVGDENPHGKHGVVLFPRLMTDWGGRWEVRVEARDAHLRVGWNAWCSEPVVVSVVVTETTDPEEFGEEKVLPE